MNKTEVIARRILDWKLNRWDRWFNHEQGVFIENFQPDQNLDHAKMVVSKLEELGFTYSQKSDGEVCFGHVCATGNSLAEAITNAAYEIADNSSPADEWL